MAKKSKVEVAVVPKKVEQLGSFVVPSLYDLPTKFQLFSLPEELMDEVIDGFDTGKLSFESASRLLGERGHPIRPGPLSRAYKHLCMQRRADDHGMMLTMYESMLQSHPPRVLANTMIALLMTWSVQLIQGCREKLPPSHVHKVLGAINDLVATLNVLANMGGNQKDMEEATISIKKKMEVITEQIYGIAG